MALYAMPLHDRLLVRRIEMPMMKGGVALPDMMKEKLPEGDVVAIGEGRMLESGVRLPMTVKIGDRVLFGKYSGNDVEIGGEELVVLREDEVVAIMKESGMAGVDAAMEGQL